MRRANGNQVIGKKINARDVEKCIERVVVRQLKRVNDEWTAGIAARLGFVAIGSSQRTRSGASRLRTGAMRNDSKCLTASAMRFFVPR